MRYNHLVKVILGLGNPGAEYENTRHNAGILFVDYLSSKLSSDYGWRREKNKMVFKTEEFFLIKTASVFMNESGHLTPNSSSTSPSIPLLISGEGSNFFLAHDDLDIKLGEYKIQRGKGPKVHRGLESVENALKTKDFWRIRIGIDDRDSDRDRESGETYVLQKFSPEEREILNGVFEKIIIEVVPHP